MKFSDSKGRLWCADITFGALLRCRTRGVDLLDEKYLSSFVADIASQVEAIYAVVEPQARELGVTQEDFCDAMPGDPLGLATQQLLEELDVFFQKAGQSAKSSVLRKSLQVLASGRDVFRTELEAIDFDALLRAEVGKISEGLPRSPASSSTD